MIVYGIVTHNNSGGAQFAMMKLKKYLSILDPDIHFKIVYLYRSSENQIDIDENSIVLVEKKSIKNIFFITTKLFQILKKNKPSAVIAFLPLATTLGLLISALAGVKARIASQRNPSDSYSKGMRILDYLAGTVGIYSSNVVNSNAVKSSFSSYPASYRKRLKIIYNAVELHAINDNSTEIRDEFNIPRNTKVLVSIARLSDQKRHWITIRSLVDIPNAHLYIAGHGERHEALKSLATELSVCDRVHFLGCLEKKSVFKLLKIADVFVQPSAYEGQSNSLLEALVMGKAIVSSDIPPQIEVLDDPKNGMVGIVVTSDDPKLWAKEINKVLNIQNHRENLENKAKERSEVFSPDQMARAFRQQILDYSK